MKNKLLLITGEFALVIGLIGYGINYFYYDNLIVYILVGILFGLSLVFNLNFLLKNRKKHYTQ